MLSESENHLPFRGWPDVQMYHAATAARFIWFWLCEAALLGTRSESHQYFKGSIVCEGKPPVAGKIGIVYLSSLPPSSQKISQGNYSKAKHFDYRLFRLRRSAPEIRTIPK